MVTKSSDTAAAIFEAATQLMLSEGDAGLRMDAVATAAGCNKRLIYHYFGNRESLVAAVYQQHCLFLRSDENGLSESTRRFLDQQFQRLGTEFATSENPYPDFVTGLRGSQDLRRSLTRAILLVVPLLLRGATGLQAATGVAVVEWQKVSAELIAVAFATEMIASSDEPSKVSERSQTPPKPRYRMASASRVVD